MKKLMVLLLSAVLLLLPVSVLAETESTIGVLVDGSFVAFDVPPTIVDGRTLVPLRAIFEALGAEVEWIAESRTVVSTLNGTEVRLTIDEPVLYKNGQTIALDVPAQLIGDRTLVPVRAISEAYGCQVGWNGAKRVVTVVSDLDAVSIASVNGEEISMGYYNFVLSQVEAYVMEFSAMGTQQLQELWNTPFYDATYGDYIVGTALEQCIYVKANAQGAKKGGVTLNDADKAVVQETIKTLSEAYKNPEEEYFKPFATTQMALEEYYTDILYAEKWMKELETKVKVSDAEIKSYLDQVYATAKHILFVTQDAVTGEPLSAEEIQAKKTLAEETLASIKKGADFDKLMLDLGEDPGVLENPDGYFFPKGVMVAEFEDAVFALKPGEVSDIVETVYGYHIIKREVNKPYDEELITQMKSMEIVDKVDEIMDQYGQEATLEYHEELYKNVVPVGMQ